VGHNLKYVGQEPKIYGLGIISKINLKDKIVSMFDYSDRCLAAADHFFDWCAGQQDDPLTIQFLQLHLPDVAGPCAPVRLRPSICNAATPWRHPSSRRARPTIQQSLPCCSPAGRRRQRRRQLRCTRWKHTSTSRTCLH